MFTVNNHVWELKFVSPTDRRLLTRDNVYTLGVTDLNTHEVCINRNLRGYMLDKVLCHELCHVYIFEYQYYMPMEIEEDVCDLVCTWGRDLFKLADEILSTLIFSKAAY